MTDTRARLPRRKLTFPLLAALQILAAVGAGWAIGTLRREQTAPPKEANSLAPTTGRGDLLYRVHCANCHGPDGHGDGLTAATLRPPPRDFAGRPWRFAPTKESIRRVVADGVPGTAMPAGKANLTSTDLDSLVDHVYLLATSLAPVVVEPSAEERLISEAGFVDLRGSDPPPLTVLDAKGQIVKLADLKGRLVLINFWGTTCEHCLKGMPFLQKLEAEWPDGQFMVLHVCADAEDAKEAQKILDQFVPNARALSDETGLGLARFEVKALPTIWLIDPAGKAIGRSHGAKDWQDPAVRQLLEHWLPAAK